MKTSEKELEVMCDVSLKPILTEAEACLFLGLSRNTLYELRISGKIAFYQEKKASGKKLLAVRYRREHLLNYIKENFDEVKPLKFKYQ